MDVQTRLHESYFKGAEKPPLIDVTIPDYLDAIAARFPDREALVSRHQDIRWTYREVRPGIAGAGHPARGPGRHLGAKRL